MSLQQTKLEKFNVLISTAESAVNTVATAVLAEANGAIAEASARIEALRTLVDSLSKRHEEEGRPHDGGTQFDCKTLAMRGVARSYALLGTVRC